MGNPFSVVPKPLPNFEHFLGVCRMSTLAPGSAPWDVFFWDAVSVLRGSEAVL